MSLNIAARALTTNQSVLQVIGNNIANANTVGYSRQSATLEAVAGQKIGNAYYGKGVELTSVKRSYDAFLAKQANSTATVAAGDELRYQKMQQIEALFPLGEGSLGTQLNNALNAWVDVQASPSDSTARAVVISRAEEFAARIRDTATRLGDLGDSARLQSAEVVKSINQLASQFAELNTKVVSGLASGQAPNDLLDQRDKVLAELNKKINVSTVTANDGSQTLFVANSYPLVMGSQAATLAVVPDPFDSQNRQVLSFVNGGVATTIDSSMLTGGEIKGLQDFVNNDLTSAQAQLGRMAFVFASEVNTQQTMGLDLTGAAGQNMFSFSSPVVSPSTTNGGTAVLSLSLANDKALAGSDYEVTYNTATTVTIRRLSDGAVVAGSPAPTTLPVTVDGLTLANVSGTANVGDRFLLRPVSDAAKDIAVVLSAPKDLAVASAVALTPGASNSRGLTIEQAVKTSATAGALPITIAFNALGQISFNAGAPQTFTPGQPMAYNGYSITLRGTPANGDTFTLNALPTNAARSNSGNAQAMLALRDVTAFDGNTTLSDGYVTVFSSVASTLSEAKFSAAFSSAQAATAETQRANKAGVNLDEEAAMLIQYQQAYQASAKYMGTVQSLFDTLMSAFR